MHIHMPCTHRNYAPVCLTYEINNCFPIQMQAGADVRIMQSAQAYVTKHIAGALQVAPANGVQRRKRATEAASMRRATRAAQVGGVLRTATELEMRGSHL